MPTWNAENDRRLLLALLAANTETHSIKFDYERVAQLCGGTTKSGVDHRFRVLRKEAQKLLADFESGTTPPQAEVQVRRSVPNTPSRKLNTQSQTPNTPGQKPNTPSQTPSTPSRKRARRAVKDEVDLDESECVFLADDDDGGEDEKLWQ